MSDSNSKLACRGAETHLDLHEASTFQKGLGIVDCMVCCKMFYQRQCVQNVMAKTYGLGLR